MHKVKKNYLNGIKIQPFVLFRTFDMNPLNISTIGENDQLYLLERETRAFEEQEDQDVIYQPVNQSTWLMITM
jgi:hypothetical protein